MPVATTTRRSKFSGRTMTDDDYAYVPEITVRRRPQPPPPEPFWCVIGEHMVEASKWADWTHKVGAMGRAPICKMCMHRWSEKLKIKPRGITQADYIDLQRLSAITTRLIWESWNGRYGSHPFDEFTQ